LRNSGQPRIFHQEFDNDRATGWALHQNVACNQQSVGKYFITVRVGCYSAANSLTTMSVERPVHPSKLPEQKG